MLHSCPRMSPRPFTPGASRASREKAPLSARARDSDRLTGFACRLFHRCADPKFWSIAPSDMQDRAVLHEARPGHFSRNVSTTADTGSGVSSKAPLLPTRALLMSHTACAHVGTDERRRALQRAPCARGSVEWIASRRWVGSGRPFEEWHTLGTISAGMDRAWVRACSIHCIAAVPSKPARYSRPAAQVNRRGYARARGDDAGRRRDHEPDREHCGRGVPVITAGEAKRRERSRCSRNARGQLLCS